MFWVRLKLATTPGDLQSIGTFKRGKLRRSSGRKTSSSMLRLSYSYGTAKTG
jgi:hypothetical protein